MKDNEKIKAEAMNTENAAVELNDEEMTEASGGASAAAMACAGLQARGAKTSSGSFDN